MSICIVTYYGLIESLQFAAKSLEKKGFKVYDFSYMIYYNGKKDYMKDLINLITNNNIKVVLWWCVNIPTNEFIEIKNKTNVKYLLFNWDDPFNWKYVDMINKMPYFDASFITCKYSVSQYLKNGCKYSQCLYPAFDPNTNFMIEKSNNSDYEKYSCDISICITNLYESTDMYPDQYIRRKILVDNIYLNQNKYGYKFYIYGPESLQKIYPSSYKGFVNYHDLNKVFNYSKINLCTHVLNNREGYLNERTILIGASGGLLLVDYVKGIEDIFKINKEIIILDKHYYVLQIVNILSNYHKYLGIKKALYEKCRNNFTYDHWSSVIVKKINEL